MTVKDFQSSSFLATKGAMVEPTYRAFQQWDLSRSLADNVRRIRQTNPIGAPSNGWLNDFGKLLLRRFDPLVEDRPLVELAQQGWDLEAWRPALLWHLSRTDPLLTDFLKSWLFELHEQGIVLIKPEAAREYLRSYLKSHLPADRSMWSDTNIAASAAGLLRSAVDFHLLRGRQVKHFEPYRLPDQSLVYLLHALMDKYQSTRRVVDADDWRLFLMRPSEVEEELLRLHQFGKLRFERAGSLLELTLPFSTAADYARSRAG
ncbi:MAG: BrxA family protein [Planctomycetota bacterium]